MTEKIFSKHSYRVSPGIIINCNLNVMSPSYLIYPQKYCFTISLFKGTHFCFTQISLLDRNVEIAHCVTTIFSSKLQKVTMLIKKAPKLLKTTSEKFFKAFTVSRFTEVIYNFSLSMGPAFLNDVLLLQYLQKRFVNCFRTRLLEF